MEESNIELFNQYLEGRLSPDEVAIVESSLANEPAFRQELEDYKALLQGISDVQQKATFKNEFARMGDEVQEEEMTMKEQFDAYLLGELPQFEKFKFEVALKLSPTLQKELKLHELSVDALKRQTYKREVEQIGKQKQAPLKVDKTEKAVAVSPRKMWWAMAASVLMMALAGGYYYVDQGTVTNPVLLYSKGESVKVSDTENAEIQGLTEEGKRLLGLFSKSSVIIRIVKSQRFGQHYRYRPEEWTLDLYVDGKQEAADFSIVFQPLKGHYELHEKSGTQPKIYRIKLESSDKPVELVQK